MSSVHSQLITARQWAIAQMLFISVGIGEATYGVSCFCHGRKDYGLVFVLMGVCLVVSRIGRHPLLTVAHGPTGIVLIRKDLPSQLIPWNSIVDFEDTNTRIRVRYISPLTVETLCFSKRRLGVAASRSLFGALCHASMINNAEQVGGCDGEKPSS